MSARSEALLACLTTEWQSSVSIADKMPADGWYTGRENAMSNINELLGRYRRYGIVESRSDDFPEPTYWRLAA